MNTEQLRHAQALAYVWGRRDERQATGANPGTCGYSGDFAEWFCVAQRTERRTIQDRYSEWVAAGFPKVAEVDAGRWLTTTEHESTEHLLPAFATVRKAEDFANAHGDQVLSNELYALGLWLGSAGASSSSDRPERTSST